MNKVIEYIIGAKDATGKAIKSALDRLKGFASSVGRNLMNIQAGFQMLGRAATAAGSFLRKAFQFEKMTVQFKTLIGSMDEAREHMKMLQDMGDTPPFSLEAFAAASRSLMVMTDGILGFKASLEMVGDAAAATGQPIENLAHEVGRAYAIIRDGQPITRATMALRNMGVLTPEVAAKMDDLQKSGASTVEIWNELETALKRYKGAMAETEQTGEGLMGAISAQWDDTLREFGAACLEASKGGLGSILEMMKQLREDGSIEVWAEGASERIGEMIQAFHALHDAMNKVGDATPKDMFDRNRGSEGNLGTFFGNAWAQLGAIGAGLRGMVVPGESFSGNYAAYGALHGYGEFADECARELSKIMKESGDWVEDMDIRDVRDAAQEEERERAKERRAEDAEKAAKKKLDEEKKVQDALAEGQRKIDAKNAEEARKNDEEDARKKAEDEEKERKAAEAAIAKESKRLWDEQVRQKRRDAQALANEAAEAQQRLAAAEANAKQAWGWYRDRDSWKAQLEEERANAAAEIQFEKDAKSLTSKSHWRTRTLDDDQEVVRRVLLAREEESNAREYARMTAEASQRAAESLERMEEVITEWSAE